MSRTNSYNRLTGSERPKALREGYCSNPFFYGQESSQGATRLVAWTPSLVQMKRLIYGVLQTFPKEGDVLFKIRVEPKKGHSRWTTYYGKVPLRKLLRAIKSNEVCVFQDGGTQLCVKRPDSGDYFAFDEDGIFFFYPNRPEIVALCRKAGFEQRVEEWISDRGHWNVEPKDADKLRERFRNYLDLKPARSVSQTP